MKKSLPIPTGFAATGVSSSEGNNLQAPRPSEIFQALSELEQLVSHLGQVEIGFRGELSPILSCAGEEIGKGDSNVTVPAASGSSCPMAARILNVNSRLEDVLSLIEETRQAIRL